MTVKRVKGYTEEPVARSARAYWATAEEGRCNGCNMSTRVAMIQGGNVLFRLCAACLNAVNRDLGGLR